MDIESIKSADGTLRISQEVIASIAKYATLEIEGVGSVSTANTGVKGLITKTNYLKPIKIELVDDVVNVELNIVVKQGYRIPDLSAQIQQNVKNAIQSMTGLAVAKIDVIVAGLAKASDSEEAE
ncbi:MAG: Asp23/Gls24 family envelope stress response protein [Oscillospiraceae bacterium]|nr:Asp23/Gls24 family envelope stress response protein [Oscillospiraceae bacterium]